MFKVFPWLALIFISFLLGGMIAVWQLRHVRGAQNFQLENGVWRVNPSMDLEKNTFQRALVSMVGLFALRESEVLYYIAREDEDGDPLRAGQDYELIGNRLDARYWSYTLYGQDFFLIPNDTKQYGYNLDNLTYNPEDSTQYRIVLSSREQYDNWLPTGKESEMTLTLRMYNPDPSVYQNLDQVELPTIRKMKPQ